MKVYLKKGDDLYPNSNWVSGVYEYRGIKYNFGAKIFPEPSDFGIDEGHISKLSIENMKTGQLVISYDRGHNYGDSRKYSRGMVKELIDYLTEYAKNNPLKYFN